MLRIILNQQLKRKAVKVLEKSRLDLQINKAHWNNSSTAESSLKYTFKTNVSSSTTSSTLRNHSAAYGWMAYSRSLEELTLKRLDRSCPNWKEMRNTLKLTDSRLLEVGFRQGCLLYTVLCDLLLDIQETLNLTHNYILISSRHFFQT
ncbi:hypothetical protein DPMN_022344 [Dreissena polymorpha]|uniref:Uncharacterized protein n=1 Tax=Dreissena polymorpha TaxID=45954 RepID=A0A9D4SBP9_DREPO|nr:hypothetical protein DPMN_022344 [Dreissena polymorpha]